MKDEIIVHDPLLHPGQVAKILSVDPRTILRWAKEGKLPSIKIPGGHHRFRTSVIRRIAGDIFK